MRIGLTALAAAALIAGVATAVVAQTQPAPNNPNTKVYAYKKTAPSTMNPGVNADPSTMARQQKPFEHLVPEFAALWDGSLVAGNEPNGWRRRRRSVAHLRSQIRVGRAAALTDFAQGCLTAAFVVTVAPQCSSSATELTTTWLSAGLLTTGASGQLRKASAAS